MSEHPSILLFGEICSLSSLYMMVSVGIFIDFLYDVRKTPSMSSLLHAFILIMYWTYSSASPTSIEALLLGAYIFIIITAS